MCAKEYVAQFVIKQFFHVIYAYIIIRILYTIIIIIIIIIYATAAVAKRKWRKNQFILHSWFLFCDLNVFSFFCGWKQQKQWNYSFSIGLFFWHFRVLLVCVSVPVFSQFFRSYHFFLYATFHFQKKVWKFTTRSFFRLYIILNNIIMISHVALSGAFLLNTLKLEQSNNTFSPLSPCIYILNKLQRKGINKKTRKYFLESFQLMTLTWFFQNVVYCFLLSFSFFLFHRSVTLFRIL